MAEGSDSTRDETSGIREDPVAEISRNNGAVVVSLAGRARPLQRTRGTRGAARMLRRGTEPARRRSEQRQVHRLDCARRADRGAHEARRTGAASCSRRRASRHGARSRSPGSTATSPCTTRSTTHSPSTSSRYVPAVDDDRILEPAELRRYADAIVKASLGVGKGDVLLVTAEPAHRELAVAVVDAGYRAGAHVVELWYTDPLAARARLEHGRDEALGVVTPWARAPVPRDRQAARRARRDHGRERARLSRRHLPEAPRASISRARRSAPRSTAARTST